MVRRHGSGTVEIRGELDGKPSTTRVFSIPTDNLDTAGICFFLAVRRSPSPREARGPKVMILDDVVVRPTYMGDLTSRRVCACGKKKKPSRAREPVTKA